MKKVKAKTMKLDAGDVTLIPVLIIFIIFALALWSTAKEQTKSRPIIGVIQIDGIPMDVQSCSFSDDGRTFSLVDYWGEAHEIQDPGHIENSVICEDESATVEKLKE